MPQYEVVRLDRQKVGAFTAAPRAPSGGLLTIGDSIYYQGGGTFHEGPAEHVVVPRSALGFREANRGHPDSGGIIPEMTEAGEITVDQDCTLLVFMRVFAAMGAGTPDANQPELGIGWHFPDETFQYGCEIIVENVHSPRTPGFGGSGDDGVWDGSNTNISRSASWLFTTKAGAVMGPITVGCINPAVQHFYNAEFAMSVYAT